MELEKHAGELARRYVWKLTKLMWQWRQARSSILVIFIALSNTTRSIKTCESVQSKIVILLLPSQLRDLWTHPKHESSLFMFVLLLSYGDNLYIFKSNTVFKQTKSSNKSPATNLLTKTSTDRRKHFCLSLLRALFALFKYYCDL